MIAKEATNSEATANEVAAAVEPIGVRRPSGDVLIAKEATNNEATANEVAAAVEPISVRRPKLIDVEPPVPLCRVPRVRVERMEDPRVDKQGTGTSAANGHGVDGKWKAVPSQPTVADLEIGGAYTVPRKKRASGVQRAAAAVDLTSLSLLSPSAWARRPLHRKKIVKNR